MTSRISLVKLIREEFRHHIVSMFASVLVFLAEILFFYFEIQRQLQYRNTEQYYRNMVAAAGAPYFRAVIPVIIIAVLLAVEYFNYLHSQKKTDFYMSLPVKRKDQFWMGVIVCGSIFAVPCIFAAVCECMIGYASGYGTVLFLQNMAWNLICKILTYLACFLTMVLAMIMTGNLVIAVMGFGAFCSYVPIFIRLLIPAFEQQFFDTYTGTFRVSSDVWSYFSPVSLAHGLVTDYEKWTIGRHMNFLIAILIFSVVIGLLAQTLYVKRPSEAAGRAMAFSKINSVIRFLVVVPIALYCGYFLQQTAPNTEIGWTFAGTIIGAVLLHGIMESIFCFDLRGMLAKKKQLGISILVCCAFILFFQMDLIKYDAFVPDVEEIESVEVMPSTDSVYFYDDVFTSKQDGIYGELIQDVVKLAEILVAQNDELIEIINLQSEQPWEQKGDIGWISIAYQMKDGSKTARQYYVDLEKEEVAALLNKISSTEEFKNDFYALYYKGSEDVMKITLDNVISMENLLLTEEEEKEFFEIYLQELTELTLTEMEENRIISTFRVNYDSSAEMEHYTGETYEIYENFDKTISFLEDCGFTIDVPLADCEVRSIEFSSEYISDTEEEPAFWVDDPEILEEVKDELILSELYEYSYVSGVKDSRRAIVNVLINNRMNYYDVYVKAETVQKLEKAAQYSVEE